MRIRRTTWRLWLYSGASLAAFVLVAVPALNGELDLQFYADSLTYERLARASSLSLDLVSVGANLLGPILILQMLGYSRWLVYGFNLLCLVVGFWAFVNHFPLDRRRFLFYLTISPLVFVSLLSINKEIISLPAVGLFAAYLERRRWGYLVAALALSVLVRWQLTLFMLVFLGMVSPLNPFRRRRLLSLAVLVLALTLVYPANLHTFEAIDRVASLAASQDTQGSGLFATFIALQNNYGYFLVFIPKTLHQMLGLLVRTSGKGEFIFFINVISVLQAAVTAGLLIRAAHLKRFVLQDTLWYLACTFAAVFALSPIYAPRYFFPVYVLVAAMVARQVPAGFRRAPARAPEVLSAAPAGGVAQ